MKPDSVVFFESPHFPKIMAYDEIDQCFINFTKAFTAEEKGKRFVIATTNTFCNGKYQCSNVFDVSVNATSYSFSLSDVGTYFDYTAFQGFAYVDDWGNDCPLESVSRVQPFEFTDITQILEIRSAYDSFEPRKQSCLWQFKAPEDFGFKIVITHLQISENVIFKVANSEETFITSTNAKETYPHYTIDNYIKIYLSKNNDTAAAPRRDPEFKAYITIIKNNLNHTLVNCSVSKHHNNTLWYYDSDSGFPHNARCRYTLKIAPKTGVIATLNSMKTEENVDVINYYDYKNGRPNSNGRISDFFLPLVFPNDDNEEREVLWEFKSDGTVYSQSFEVEFETKYCSCANPEIIVPCHGSIRKNLMEDDNDFYCGNLKCNFTIKLNSSCTSQFIVLELYNHINDEKSDIFRAISNNVTIFEMGLRNSEENRRIYMPSANHNIFQAVTFVSPYERTFTITAFAFSVSTIPQSIILNETKPYHLYEFCLFNEMVPYILSVELSLELKQRNATIDFFIYDKDDLYDLSIYSDPNLSYQLNLQNCMLEVAHSVYKCKTNMASLVLVKFGAKERCNTYLLFQATTQEGNVIGNEGCVFKNNVFNLAYTFSAMSNTKMKCKIFCFALWRFNNQQIWISPKTNGSINIFAGIQEKIFASIDTTATQQWHDLAIYENIYIIEIPLYSMIMFSGDPNLDFYPIAIYDGSVNISSIPFKTIVTSPNYGSNAVLSDLDTDFACDGTPFRIFYIQNVEIRFTMLNIDVASSNYFYFLNNKTQIKINSTLQSITFQPGQVGLYCVCQSSVHCSIRMLVEAISVADATTLMTSNTTLIPTKRPTLTSTGKSFSYTSTINNFLLLLQAFMMLQC